MNIFSKKTNAFIMCAMMVTTTFAYSMENDVAIVVVEQEMPENTTVVWYKQRPVQIAAAALATAAAIYSYAVYNNKMSSPAVLYTGLFCTKVVTTITTEASENDVNGVHNSSVTITKTEVVVTESTTEDNQHINNVDPVVVSQNNEQDKQVNNDINDPNVSEVNPLNENGQDQEISNDTQKEEVIVVAEKTVESNMEVAISKAKLFAREFKKAAQEWASSDSDITQ